MERFVFPRNVSTSEFMYLLQGSRGTIIIQENSSEMNSITQIVLFRLIYVTMNNHWQNAQTSEMDVAHQRSNRTNELPSLQSPNESSTVKRSSSLNKIQGVKKNIRSMSSSLFKVNAQEDSGSVSPVNLNKPEAIDDRVCEQLYCITMDILTKIPGNTDLIGRLDCSKDGLNNLPVDFRTFMDLQKPVVKALFEPISNYYKDELGIYAGKILFCLSASNWDYFLHKLTGYFKTDAQKEDASSSSNEAPELKILEWCHLDSQKLMSVLRGLNEMLGSSDKTCSLRLPAMIRRAIWNFIELFPEQFREIQRQNISFSTLADNLFDYYAKFADNQRRKNAIWPLLTSLILLNPDVLSSVVFMSQTASTESLSKKVFPYAYFLESLKQSHKQSKNSPLAYICLIDLCKAAVIVKDEKSNALKSLVPGIEQELAAKFFNPSKAFWSIEPILISKIAVEFLVSCFLRDSSNFFTNYYSNFLSKKSNNTAKLMLIKALYLIASRNRSTDGTSGLVNLYVHLSENLRGFFQQSLRDCFGGPSINESSFSRILGANKSKKADMDSENNDLLFSILKLFNADPLLAIWCDKAAHKLDATKSVLMNLTHILQHSSSVIREASSHLLLELHRQDLMLQWGPKSQPILSFWIISSHVTEKVADNLLVSHEIDENLEAFYLELLLKILICRNSFIETYRDESEQNLELSERRACNQKVETALLISLCSAKTAKITLALACLEQYCLEALILDSGEDFLQIQQSDLNEQVYIANSRAYKSFLESIALKGGITGRVAIQKKIRRMLRSLEKPSSGILKAWLEVYNRWVGMALYEKFEERFLDNGEKTKGRNSIRSNVFNGKNSTQKSLASSSQGSVDESVEWQNYMGFLCALGGCCVDDTSYASKMIAKDPKPKSPNSSNENILVIDSLSVKSSVDRLIEEILALLVAGKPSMREVVKEILGSELSPKLYPTLFKYLGDFTLKFSSDGVITCNEMATFHVDQAISIIKLTVERINDHAFDTFIDIGKLLLSYVKYLTKLGRDNESQKIKIKFCHLCELIIQKRELIPLKEEIKLRNILFENFVEWTSDFSEKENFKSELPSLNHSKITRDLDNACMKSIVVVVYQLPLQPIEIRDTENISDARSRLFNKYFLFFIRVMKRCKIESAAENGAHNFPAELAKDLSQLKGNTILALSNLLSSNIDCGLKYSLSAGYHEDSKLRSAFMEALSNILRGGVEFDTLADSYYNDRYKKLVDLLFESDFMVTIALCDSCPLSNLDELASLLLPIFETKNQTIKLLKTLIEREISKSDSFATLFRRNSIVTKLITLYAKAHGMEYQKKVLDPVWKDLADIEPNKSYEIDPFKAVDATDIEENRKNLIWLTKKFLDAILSSADLVPQNIRYVCSYLYWATSERYPESNLATVVGGFMFLRFFCPSIVSPTTSQTLVLTKNFTRGLVLATKVIQNLGNNVLFGSKEPYMKELNPFLAEKMGKVEEFLNNLGKSQKPDISKYAISESKVEDAHLHSLHGFMSNNLDNIGKELQSRKAIVFSGPPIPLVMASSVNHAQAPPVKMSESLSKTPLIGRKHFDTLSTLLAQLGPPPESSKKSYDSDNIKTSSNHIYAEFMIRNEHRKVTHLENMNFFYQGGISKSKRAVFYFVPGALNLSSVDIELAIYFILKSLKPHQTRPFDIFVDLTLFKDGSEPQSQWIAQFLQLVPAELTNNLKCVLVYNINTFSKNYLKRISRYFSSKFFRKFVFINSAIELNEYISPLEQRLPRATTALDEENTVFDLVTRMVNFRQNAQVLLKINSRALQIVYKKKQSFINQTVQVTDIIPTSDIDDVYLTDKSGDEEFVVRFDHGKSSVTFFSPRRNAIVNALKSAMSQSDYKALPSKERVIRPSDVPGALLNMALLNMGSDDHHLRHSAYNLLCVLSLVFNFDVGNQLLAAKEMIVPGNNTNFVSNISDKLAQTEPHLTLEFLKECFIGFNNSSTELKHFCLEYMAPWLSNLVEVSENSPNESLSTRNQVDNILIMLMDLTVKETFMYPSLQSKVWHRLGSIEKILPVVIDSFVDYACKNDLGSQESEIIADTCVTLASANVQIVSGRIISRLRKVIQNTSIEAARSLVEHRSWKEICVMVRFCLMLSFNNRLHVQQYIPELFHIISMLAACGPMLIRSSVYGLLVNIIHSLCTSALLNEQQVIALNMILNEFSEPRFRLLFGINRDSADAFTMTKNAFSDSSEKMTLGSLAIVINYLAEVVNIGAISKDELNVWRARWMGLAVNTAFQFNPALQPRAFVALGSISKDDIDDDLLFQILSTLRRALLFFEDSDCDLIVSSVMCISSIIENSLDESRYFYSLFWLGICLAGVGHPSLFSGALELIQNTLRNLSSRGLFKNESPEIVFMNFSSSLNPIAQRLEESLGVSFSTNFAYSVVTILCKGLNSIITKTMTISTLSLFAEIFHKHSHLKNRRPEASYPDFYEKIDAHVVPYIIPLLPILEPGEVAELFWTLGVEFDDPSDYFTNENDEFRDEIIVLMTENSARFRYQPLLRYLEVEDPDDGRLMITSLLIMLENVEFDSESFFIYSFLTECAVKFPECFDVVLPRLIPKIVQVLSSSHSVPILESVRRLLSILLDKKSIKNFMHRSQELGSIEETSKDQANPLDELKFPGMYYHECGNFDSVSRQKKLQMSNMCSEVLDAIL